eukprot:scaffold5956_cov21-Tisochrysis_lutea.AAC.1
MQFSSSSSASARSVSNAKHLMLISDEPDESSTLTLSRLLFVHMHARKRCLTCASIPGNACLGAILLTIPQRATRCALWHCA